MLSNVPSTLRIPIIIFPDTNTTLYMYTYFRPYPYGAGQYSYKEQSSDFSVWIVCKSTLSKEIIQLGVGSHVSNPNTQEAEGERSTWDTY